MFDSINSFIIIKLSEDIQNWIAMVLKKNEETGKIHLVNMNLFFY